MTITRRTLLKQMGIIAGGIILLPGCHSSPPFETVKLNNIKLNSDDQLLIGNVSEAILPKGQQPGAMDLKVHQFVVKMIDDCQSQQAQDKYLKGIALFRERAEKTFGDDFASLTPQQQEDMMLTIDSEMNSNTKAEPTPEATFLSLTKQYTIQGYLQSEYIMTNVLVHHMLPGAFHGCISPTPLQIISA